MSSPSPNPKPSIDAVARMAKVSTATVSRVLNSSKPVAEATRQRVQAAVDALGFRASTWARGLSTGRSHMLLALVPALNQPCTAEIVRGATTRARQQGYTLLTLAIEGATATADAEQQALAGTLADGVINLLPLALRPAWLGLLHGRPWVNCGEFNPDDGVPQAGMAQAQAATDAVQYLINCGHGRIALVSADHGLLHAQQRRLGFEAALRRAGLGVDAGLQVRAAANTCASGAAAVAALVWQPAPPTAALALSDTLAVGVIKGLRQAGLRVPADVAVIGFDDEPIAEVFEPALTTVAQPLQGLGAAAVDLLLARLAGESPADVVLAHRLVLRDSA